MSDLRRDAKIVVGSVVATCIAFAIGLAWIAFKPSLPSVLGVVPPKFADAKTETVPCKTVQALAPKVKKEVGLPVAVQKDEQASVLAIAVVPRSDNPLFATSVLHRDTGIGEIYFTPQPRPWLAFDRRWLVGGFYSLRDGQTEPVGELLGLYDLAQIKALHVGAMAHLDTTGRRSLGIGVWASGR